MIEVLTNETYRPPSNTSRETDPETDVPLWSLDVSVQFGSDLVSEWSKKMSEREREKRREEKGSRNRDEVHDNGSWWCQAVCSPFFSFWWHWKWNAIKRSRTTGPQLRCSSNPLQLSSEQRTWSVFHHKTSYNVKDFFFDNLRWRINRPGNLVANVVISVPSPFTVIPSLSHIYSIGEGHLHHI